jgi:hypothetical protein
MLGPVRRRSVSTRFSTKPQTMMGARGIEPDEVVID